MSLLLGTAAGSAHLEALDDDAEAPAPAPNAALLASPLVEETPAGSPPWA